MKIRFRLLALILALLLSVPALAACDNNVIDGASTDTNPVSDTDETEILPEIAKNNYGEDFYLAVLGDSNPMKYYWVEEGENDAMSEAIFDRQSKVNEYLGVEIVGTPAGSYGSYAESFKTSVKNKDGSIHSLLTHVYQGVAGLVSENYLTDFNDLQGVNLDADYWNRDFMEGLAVKDHLYLGYSDFKLAYTYVLTFNKTMLAQYSDSMEEPIYDTVKNYRWTLDEMISLVNLVYIDATGDGKTEDDTFGLAGNQWVPFIGFMHACGLNLVSIDDSGDYVVSPYTSQNQAKTSDIVDRFLDLANSDSAWFKYKVEETPDVAITSGRTLLHLDSTYWLPNYLSYDVDFGVIPYPMYDEAQKDVGYRSLQWGGYITVPSYLENPTMVGETLEILAFYSDDVTMTFYEKLLGKQVADVPDDRVMLDIIWDSVCSDFGQTYSSIDPLLDNLLYMLPNLTHSNTTSNLASYMAGIERTANKKIKRFLNDID